jgi:protoporphyrinogen oxidase
MHNSGMEREKRTAVIIGAGPAGLTAAYELMQRTDVLPEVFELGDFIGGLSRTVNYKGNRMDIGGHRFFSKSDRVMNWWKEILPVQAVPAGENGRVTLSYQNRQTTLERDSAGPDPAKTDRVMLVRNRLSRIFFIRRFFDYPIALSARTVWTLGPVRMARMGLSYTRACLFPIKPERTLEDFFINRFGRELYATFFRDYTEKVWGVSCKEIKPEWGAQRIKGLSITRALLHAAKSMLPGKRDGSVAQKKTETSLIDRFLYPKFGPGQMWEEVASRITAGGATIHHNSKAERIEWNGNQITSVGFRNAAGKMETREADFYFSTMPIKDFVAAMSPEPSADIREIAAGLVYRDFITVGLLLRKMAVKNDGPSAANGLVRDNWIYIQERDVKIGRLQIFNNWSPYLVKDPETVWLGLEYFCNEGDELWRKSDAEMSAFAAAELAKLELINPADVLDSVVIRVPKTYPSYVGSYDRFERVRAFLSGFENLFLIGRNGMHRYNNQDHSMLTAMTAVDNIAAGVRSKDNIWAVNTEMEYHEAKSAPQSSPVAAPR